MITVGNIVYTACFNGKWYIEEILNIEDTTVTVRPIVSSIELAYYIVDLREYTSAKNTVVILGNSEAKARSNYPEYFI